MRTTSIVVASLLLAVVAEADDTPTSKMTGHEVIEVEDRAPPKVLPKPKHDTQKSLPYSDEAVLRDAWGRAWLLLDIDEKGQVTRLKMLKRPGFDLDAIAIREAFKLSFEPALDEAGKSTKTYVVWLMEWPSNGWIVQGSGVTTRRPKEQDGFDHLSLALRPVPKASGTMFDHPAAAPCAGSGPLNLDLWNLAYSDCSRPDMSLAATLPWITRDTAETAIAEIAQRERAIDREAAPHHSRVPAIISAGVTGALLGTTLLAYLRYDKYVGQVRDASWKLTIDPDEYRKHEDRRDKWGRISLGLAAASVVSGAVTLFLWNKDQSPRSFSVQPTGDGAAVSFDSSF